MTLQDFKKKYFRSIRGHNKPAPFCSDGTETDDNIFLLQEPWHRAAGIVTATQSYPFEHHDTLSWFSQNPITIAGVTPKLLVYHFIDTGLYRITAWLPSESFAEISEAFATKYGVPNVQDVDIVENTYGKQFKKQTFEWHNNISYIRLSQFHGDLATSGLVLVHRHLDALAEQRRPGPKVDDI